MSERRIKIAGDQDLPLKQDSAGRLEVIWAG